MMVRALVIVAAATDVTLSLQGDSASPGTVDGLRTDASVGYGRRFGLTAYGGVRTNATAFDSRTEMAWFQHSQAGLLAPDGTIPIGADVWSAGALLGARVGRGNVHGRVQVGWGLRGQSTAALGFVDGHYDFFDDGTEGRVHLRAANPVVGVDLRIPIAEPVTASLTVRQYFPLNDPVVDLLPGITVVGVGLGFGRSAGASGGGAQPPQTDILPTGVADVDALFAEVQGIRDELASLQDSFSSAERALDSIATTLGTTSAPELMQALRDGALDVQVRLEVRGGRPVVVPTAEVHGDVAALVSAVERLADAIQDVKKSAPVLAKRSKALVEQAKALAQSGPALVKQAKLPPMEVPGALRALQGNVKITAGVPQEVAATVEAATRLTAMLTGTGG